MEAKSVSSSQLSSECWTVQFEGLKACKSCPNKGKDCGGKNIRKTGKNENGFSVPLGKPL